MKKKAVHKKIYIIIYMMSILLIVFEPTKVKAADLLICANGPTESKKGTKIVLDISIKNNPTITTLGLQVKYDDSVLKYVEATWNPQIVSDNDNIMLVSDVNSDNTSALNVSLVSYKGYEANDNVISLTFEVTQDFSDFPFVIYYRDGTDKDLKSILDYKIETNQNIENEEMHDDTNGIQGENIKNEKNSINEVKQKDSEIETVVQENYDKTYQTGNVDIITLIVKVILICTCVFLIGMVVIKKIK